MFVCLIHIFQKLETLYLLVSWHFLYCGYSPASVVTYSALPEAFLVVEVSKPYLVFFGIERDFRVID